MRDEGIIVTSFENSPGQITIAMYERHAVGEPGLVMRKELSLFEMESLHTAITKALWCHIRQMAI
jgi:hypothetical protein